MQQHRLSRRALLKLVAFIGRERNGVFLSSAAADEDAGDD